MAAQIDTRTDAAAQPENTKRERLLFLLNRIEFLETKIKKMEATGCTGTSGLR